MTLKKILICFITLILAAGASYAADSLDISLDNLPPVVDNMYDFPYFKAYKLKKGEIVLMKLQKLLTLLIRLRLQIKQEAIFPAPAAQTSLLFIPMDILRAQAQMNLARKPLLKEIL